jgi:hypothetical protein
LNKEKEIKMGKGKGANGRHEKTNVVTNDKRCLKNNH